jgi:hypothetical protein
MGEQKQKRPYNKQLAEKWPKKIPVDLMLIKKIFPQQNRRPNSLNQNAPNQKRESRV